MLCHVEQEGDDAPCQKGLSGALKILQGSEADVMTGLRKSGGSPLGSSGGTMLSHTM